MIFRRNNMKPMSSIILEIEKQKSVEKQVQLLKINSSTHLKNIIGYAMDPTVKWLLPEGDPPYRPLPITADQEGRLYSEIRRLKYFINTEEGLNLNQTKREQLFIQLLESIDAHDATLILRIKNGDLKIKKEAVKIAFPGITKHW